jgi:hypothetical protein
VRNRASGGPFAWGRKSPVEISEAAGRLSLAQQLRQLGEVRRHPPRGVTNRHSPARGDAKSLSPIVGSSSLKIRNDTAHKVFGAGGGDLAFDPFPSVPTKNLGTGDARPPAKKRAVIHLNPDAHIGSLETSDGILAGAFHTNAQIVPDVSVNVIGCLTWIRHNAPVPTDYWHSLSRSKECGSWHARPFSISNFVRGGINSATKMNLSHVEKITLVFDRKWED